MVYRTIYGIMCYSSNCPNYGAPPHHVRQNQKLFLTKLKYFHHHFLFGYISVHVWLHVHMKICLALFMSNHSGDCIKSISLWPKIFFYCHQCDFVKLSVLMVVIEILLAAMT